MRGCMHPAKSMEGCTQESADVDDPWRRDLANRVVGRRGKELVLYSFLFYLMFLSYACIAFIVNKFVKIKVN